MKRFTVLTVIAVVGLVIVVSTAGCSSNITPSTSQMTTYDSGNFTIQRPSDWKNTTTDDLSTNSAYFAPEGKDVSVFVSSPKDVKTTLHSWTSAHNTTFEQLQKYSTKTYVEKGDTTLAGNPAYKIVYTEHAGSGDSKVTEIWTVHEGKVYDIMYKADLKLYDTYADTAQKMIDSFQIK